MSDYDSIKYNNTSKDPTILGTDGMVVPKGTTAERIGTTTGKLRYNTDLGFLEQYNATGWAGIDAPPTVSSVTGVINEDVDATITVLGSNFKSGSQVSITGAAVSGIDRPLSTTFINSGELTAASNASSVNFVGGASYNGNIAGGTAGVAGSSNGGVGTRGSGGGGGGSETTSGANGGEGEIRYRFLAVS